ncbi:MAG: glycosyltransferase [bacterium]|nr:glycosyltransferase [bacterium]
MRPRNILHLISKFTGDNPLFDDFILHLDPSRFRSIVCFLRGSSGQDTVLERAAIETIYLEGVYKKKRGISLSKLRKLKAVVRDKEIDLIHCHRHKPTVYAALLSMLGKPIPVVSTVHGRMRTRSLGRVVTNRLILKYVDRIIGVSHSVRKDILKTNPGLADEKVVTVQNGIDYEKILKISCFSRHDMRREILGGYEKHYWFGTVGRLKPVKNHDRLVRAFAGVADRMPDAILVIAGNGPLEADLRKTIETLNLEERVFLLGYREDIPCILRCFDVFVFPSLSEGLGLAMLEAMASELPVIASRIDSSDEVMGDVPCGVLFDPEDTEDMAQSMLKFRQLSADAQKSMGKMARQRVVDAFTIERMTRGIVDVYDGLLHSLHGSRKARLQCHL